MYNPAEYAARERCSIPGCNKPKNGRGWCATHYDRWKLYGDPVAPLLRRKQGTGSIRSNGYIGVEIKKPDGTWGLHKLVHRTVAEKVLGRPLRKEEVIHHVDGDRANNEPTNLVICPDHAYHHMLHRRERALDASGHADWLKCTYCQEYDDPKYLLVYPHKNRGGFNKWHRDCQAAYSKGMKRVDGRWV